MAAAIGKQLDLNKPFYCLINIPASTQKISMVIDAPLDKIKQRFISIFTACREGNLKKVQQLMEKEEYVNVSAIHTGAKFSMENQQIDGISALEVACLCAHYDIAERILKSGATNKKTTCDIDLIILQNQSVYSAFAKSWKNKAAEHSPSELKADICAKIKESSSKTDQEAGGMYNNIQEMDIISLLAFLTGYCKIPLKSNFEWEKTNKVELCAIRDFIQDNLKDLQAKEQEEEKNS